VLLRGARTQRRWVSDPDALSYPVLLVCCAEASASDVPTHHNDPARTGLAPFSTKKTCPEARSKTGISAGFSRWWSTLKRFDGSLLGHPKQAGDAQVDLL